MVTFQTPDGTPGFHESDRLEDAITFVERLRNDQGVQSSRIYRMEEMSFDFRPYYKVELSTGATAEAPTIAPAPATPDPAPVAPPEAPSGEASAEPPPPRIPTPPPPPDAGTGRPIDLTEEETAPPPPPPAESPRRGLFSRQP